MRRFCFFVTTIVLLGNFFSCSSLPEGETEKPQTIRANEAKQLFTLGEENIALGAYTQAETYYHKALEANAAIDNQDGVAECHNALGSLYLLVADPDGAAKAFYQALDAAKQVSNADLEAKSLANLAKSHLAKGQFDQALALLDQAEAKVGASNILLQAIIYHNRGSALFSKDDPKARQSFEHALELNIKGGALRERAANLYMLARICLIAQTITISP
jgi:tetratricopeptide (TPR) repeat protein